MERSKNIGDFILNHYSISLQIFNKCNIQDKILLCLIKIFHILIILMVIFGWMLPKKYLLWHITLCFIILFNLDVYKDKTIMNELIYNILDRNIDKDTPKEALLNASKLIPISIFTSKTILFISMILSLFGYIYPEYSGNNLIKSLDGKLKNIECEDNKMNDQYINTEFEIKINTIPKIEYQTINENQIEENMELLNNGNKLLNSEQINESSQLDINEIDNNLSIFNKIEPIKIEIIKDTMTHKVKEQIGLLKNKNDINILESNFIEKIEPEYKLVIDKIKLKNSLKEFNELLNE